VSKIHTSIQEAIKKSRRSRPSGQSARHDDISTASSQEDKTGSGIFQIFQTAQTDKEVMEESRFVSEVDDRRAVAAYKILRTRVLQRMRSNNWRNLLVTSAGAGEGKTLTASNLALSLARDVNQSVLLVDLDLQRSKVAQYFGFDIDVKNGIGEYLNGSADIPDIVYSPSDLERISIIPNRDVFEHSSDLLSGPRMRELLAWIRQQSDRTIVIFDMPPVLVDDDVLAFCPEVDAVLLVVAQGKTDRTSLEKAMSLLAEMNLLGVVLNKCDEMEAENAYGYY
jgi:protein-tyrosine kinase